MIDKRTRVVEQGDNVLQLHRNTVTTDIDLMASYHFWCEIISQNPTVSFKVCGDSLLADLVGSVGVKSLYC